MEIPWSERVNMLSINPDAASRDDVAKMAAELSDAKAIEKERDRLKAELAKKSAEKEVVEERLRKVLLRLDSEEEE